MKCEICGKDILNDSQCIDYKYYHNDCIINLTKENQKYKEAIDKAIEINKQIKEFVYNEMVDRCVPGSTELYELVKEELKILKGGKE